MRKAVSYARVSTKEQEQGFSLESQSNTLNGYAASKGFRIVKEFAFSESAKDQGRKHFNSMIDYVRKNPDVRVIIVEKTDRLCRNLPDFVLIEDLVKELGLEIHLVKDGQVLQEDSTSQDKLVQGMFALLARNYILNMQEEILKGQLVKAGKGQYPGRAPIGYAHDRETRTIVADPETAGVVTLAFELYSSGAYSVSELRKILLEKTGKNISKSNLFRVLQKRFYLGIFSWRGREYQGIHPPLVDSVTFEAVQDILTGRNGNKAKPRKHFFPFGGMMHCAADNCVITADLAKGKYVYYRCSFGRGKHPFPYMKEQTVSDMLGTTLKQIEMPSEVVHSIVDSISGGRSGIEAKRQEEIHEIKQNLATLQTCMREAYQDKAAGIIDEEFWLRNQKEWTAQERSLKEAQDRALKAANVDCSPIVRKTLELAQHAHSMYLTGTFADRAKLLKMVLSNCVTDGVSVCPTYRKPFDLIFKSAQNEDWRREWDSNPR